MNLNIKNKKNINNYYKAFFKKYISDIYFYIFYLYFNKIIYILYFITNFYFKYYR